MSLPPPFLIDLSTSLLPFGRNALPPELPTPTPDASGTLPDVRLGTVPNWRYLQQIQRGTTFVLNIAGNWTHTNGDASGSAAFSLALPFFTGAMPLYYVRAQPDPVTTLVQYLQAGYAYPTGVQDDAIGTYTDGDGEHDVFLVITAPTFADIGAEPGWLMCQGLEASATKFRVGFFGAIYLSVICPDASGFAGGFVPVTVVIHTGASALSWYPYADPDPTHWDGYSEMDAGTMFGGSVPLKIFTAGFHDHPEDPSDVDTDFNVTGFSIDTPAL